MIKKGAGIFVIKTALNDGQIEFTTILAPENVSTAKRVHNTETPVKQHQLKYWEKYSEICDTLALGDFQISPAARHYQYVTIGKSGVTLMLTVNTQNPYVACELLINSDKAIYHSLLKHKDAIEKSLGELSWHELPDKKSSKIRKTFEIDVNDEANFETAVNAQIKMAQEFKDEFSKYLNK